MNQPKRRFVVAGPQYPDAIRWPSNVERIEHLAPAEHRAILQFAALHLECDAARDGARRMVA